MLEQDIIKEEKLRENKYVTAMLEEEVKKQPELPLTEVEPEDELELKQMRLRKKEEERQERLRK